MSLVVGSHGEGVTRPVHSGACCCLPHSLSGGRGLQESRHGRKAKGRVSRAQEPPALVSYCCITNDP